MIRIDFNENFKIERKIMDRFITELGYQEIALRVIAAIFIGGIIGYEREKNNRPAGFRTHILVCLGAAITSIIQDRMRIDVLRLATTQPEAMQAIKLDLGRLGAQVISGIGFLGAGSIMRERGTVEGLTTAARSEEHTSELQSRQY